MRKFNTSRYSFHTEDLKTLGLKKNANRREIKEAYYSLAKDLHPDTKKSKEPTSTASFREINVHIYLDTISKLNFMKGQNGY